MKSTKLLVLLLSLSAAVALIWRFWDVAMPFFGAAIIAYLLGPLVNRICRSGKVRRGLAVIVVLLLVVGLLAGFLSVTIPYAVTQVGALVKDISSYASNLDQIIDRAMNWLGGLHLPQPILDKAAEILSQADVYLMRVFTAILEWLVNFSTGLFDVIIIVILIIYFLLDGRKLIRGILNKLPLEMSNRATRILRDTDKMIWKYLRSRVLLSGGMAVVTYIGLTIMGLRYAAVFAVLSFILDFVPYFGSFIAGAIEGVYALVTGGIGLALTVLIFVLVVQQIEGNIVAPKLQADAVGIHPITVLFSLLACSEIWGPVGMLISTPVAGVFKILSSEVYRYLTAGLITPETLAAAEAAKPPKETPPEPPAPPAPPAPSGPDEDREAGTRTLPLESTPK